MTKRKFAAFDIDGTLFRSGLYREVFHQLAKMGALPEHLAERANESHSQWHRRTHSDAFANFEDTLVQSFDDFLPQLRLEDYDKAVARVMAKKSEDTYVYTRNLLQKLQADGYFTIAISGSQQELVESFAKLYNFDAWIGQKWQRGDDHFTGAMVKTHTGKDVLLEKFISQYDLDTKDSYAVGDTNGDIGMFELVDNPIAFNPSHELLEKVLQKGWRVVIERKDVSYELTNSEAGGYKLQNFTKL